MLSFAFFKMNKRLIIFFMNRKRHAEIDIIFVSSMRLILFIISKI